MWHMRTLHSDGTNIYIENYETHTPVLHSLMNRTDNEFMDYVYTMIKDLPVFSERKEILTYMKNEGKSIEFRKEGNDLFIRRKEYLMALQMYTRSIATADYYSADICIAYANRSAVLFECGYYKECIEDIDRALKKNYPDHLKKKLLLRKQKAYSLKHAQKVYKYHEPIPEIENKNPLIQSGSDAIRIEINDKWGRHIVAAKEIKAGDILIVEKPYVQAVEPRNRYLHCDECMELCYNMIPCEGCTQVLYCSRNCLQTASKAYHEVECVLMQMGMEVPRLFLRLVLKGIPEFKTMISSKSDDKEIYRSDRYKEVYDLQTHKEDKTAYDLYQDSLECVVVYYYLNDYTELVDEMKIKKKEQVLKRLLFRHQLAVPFNVTCVTKTHIKSVKTAQCVTVGTTIYSLFSLINHSCNANCFAVSSGSHVVLRAIRDIPKGEPVTISYGYTYGSFKKSMRQIHLQRTYYFTCTCEACIADWPCNDKLPQGKPIPQEFLQKCSQLFKGATVDVKVINELLSEGYEIASTLRMPSRNWNCISGVIVELFALTGNKIFAF